MKNLVLFLMALMVFGASLVRAEEAWNGGELAVGSFRIVATLDQPRCPNCKKIEMNVYNAGPIGNTFITKVRMELRKKRALIDFFVPTLTKSIETYPVIDQYEATVDAPYGQGRDAKNYDLVITGYGKKCMNPMQPECDELVVKETSKVSYDKIMGL